MPYSGIYKIKFPNNKIYIGLSSNIQRRIKEHNSSAHSSVAKDKDLPVHRAIRKYGKIQLGENVDIIEFIDAENHKMLQEREIYWIKFYNSENKEKGYNLTIGGDGSSPGIANHEAKLNKLQLDEIYNLLINHRELFIYQIAEMYNMSPEAISDINNGKRYFNDTLKYPLRGCPKVYKPSGTDNPLSKFSEQDIEEIYNLLMNENNLSLVDIAKKKNVCYATISNINRGLRYKKPGYTYPLRKNKAKSKRNLTNEQISLSTDLLINSNLSLRAISNIVGCSYDSIKRINKGETYHRELKYPLRNT